MPERLPGGGLLEVCDYAGPYPGNFIPSLIATGVAARERLGLAPHFVFPREASERPWMPLMSEAGIPVSYADREGGKLARARVLTRLARSTRAALVRSHFTLWDLEASVAGRVAGARVIWHVHSGSIEITGRQQLSDLVKIRALGWMYDSFAVVSDQIGREGTERGVRPRKLAIVANGIDLDRFPDPPRHDRAAVRERFDLPQNSFVVLAFGWTPHIKGIDVLVSAVETPEPLKNVVMLLVGKDVLRESLPADLPPWMRFSFPVQDPAELFTAADVFVSASRQEGFSYAIGEAMAARMPVISSDIPGPSFYFDADGVTTYPVDDPNAMRLAIQAARTADSSAAGEANRAFVRDRLPLSRHVEDSLALFERVLGQTGRPYQ